MSRRLLPLLLLGVIALPSQLDGQGLRGRARTYLSYIELREIVPDSVPTGSVAGDGIWRRLPDGTPVTCLEGYCQFFRSGSTLGVAPLIQDLELNVWTGIVGLRSYIHIRGRRPLGDHELWPRSQQDFEALAAYLEYDRSFYRVKGGRLWKTTRLGFYNMDGVDLELRLPWRIDIGGYAGYSLVRGLNQRHTGDLLSAVEEIPPSDDAYIFGINARWRPSPHFSSSLVYQREIRTDDAALYSERIAGSARVLFAGASVDVVWKHDLATNETNDGRIRISGPLMERWRGSLEVRHYRPYFDLWTIWGAFSPVGFAEGTVRMDWRSASGRAAGHLGGGYRKYEDTDAGTNFLPMRDDGLRMILGVQLKPTGQFVVNGEYRVEAGFGATRSGGDLSIQHPLGAAGYVALRGTAFQTISEFSVGEGAVYGGGGDLAVPIGPAKAHGGVMFYHHNQKNRPQYLDWNQKRVTFSLEIPIGRDPGLNRRAER